MFTKIMSVLKTISYVPEWTFVLLLLFTRKLSTWLLSCILIYMTPLPNDKCQKIIDSFSGTFLYYICKNNTVLGKIGQVISDSSTEYSYEFRYPLMKLSKDAIKPKSWKQVDKLLCESWKTDHIYNICEWIDSQPLAHGTIGQVHKAIIKGEKVVIKIVFPERLEQIKYWMKFMRVMGFIFSTYNVITIERILTTLVRYQELLTESCNMIQEAKNTNYFYKKYHGKQDNFIVPRIYDEYTRSNIIVQQYMKMISPRNSDTIDWSLYNTSRQQITTRIINSLLLMLCLNGKCHGDLQTENWGIDPQSGKLVYIDWGIIAKCKTKKEKKCNMYFLAYFCNADWQSIALLTYHNCTIFPPGITDEKKKEFLDGLAKPWENCFTGSSTDWKDGMTALNKYYEDHKCTNTSMFDTIRAALLTCQGSIATISGSSRYTHLFQQTMSEFGLDIAPYSSIRDREEKRKKMERENGECENDDDADEDEELVSEEEDDDEEEEEEEEEERPSPE